VAFLSPGHGWGLQFLGVGVLDPDSPMPCISQGWPTVVPTGLVVGCLGWWCSPPCPPVAHWAGGGPLVNVSAESVAHKESRSRAGWGVVI